MGPAGRGAVTAGLLDLEPPAGGRTQDRGHLAPPTLDRPAADGGARATVAQTSLPAFPIGYQDSHPEVTEIADRIRLVVQDARFGLDCERSTT